MFRHSILLGLMGALTSGTAYCQNEPVPPPERTVPLYKVTVVERSLQAVNYEYRSMPTEIDFRGTVLLPNSKGHATIESKRGRTEIDAKLEKLTPPTPLGRQYLTYVLWAISPEGAPHNLGEVVTNGNDNAHVHVTTGLQAFGLLITAEPYAAVRQPSDVVVMENQIRPDTIGRTQPIIAKAELLSRGQFTYDKQASLSAMAENAPKVSMDEYEQLSEIYQAQNAIGIARAANAEQLAPDTFNKAVASYNEAQRLKSTKAGVSLVVQAAREAAQTADDARVIASRRAQDDRVAQAEQQAAAAQQALAQARADAQQARAEADAARNQAEANRIARQRAESDAAEVPSNGPVPSTVPAPAAAAPPVNSQDLPIAPPPPPAPTPGNNPPPQAMNNNRRQQEARMRLLQGLNSVTSTRDTPRGLVVTLPDSSFETAFVRSSAADTLSRLASVLRQPGLQVTVEGFSDSAAGAVLSQQRADAVRDSLVRRGVNPAMVNSRNIGDGRPITSNATAGGRVQNRRVEIIVAGDAIGSQPLWDRSYDVTLR